VSSLIKTHKHDNYDILKEFSEAYGSLLYKGKPIIATSTHETELVNTEKGIHGLRYYNNKLQHYYGNKWNDISTGGGTTVVTDKDIIISPTKDNALVKYQNGYYVPSFLVSKQANNALVKYSDGYYVPKIPVNNALLDDIEEAKDEINKTMVQNIDNVNQKYYTLVQKVSEIAANTTKSDTHHYSGDKAVLDTIIDISTLYNEAVNVILNMELMIKNQSEKNSLEIQIIENEIETMGVTLEPLEVQRYKLTNTPHIEIKSCGSYEVYLYVQYI
jgi:hypothetical protein